MLRKLTSASIIDCGLQCAIEDGCKSINYKKTSPSKTPDNCELNAATASISDKPKHLIKDGMFSYYELFNLEKVRTFHPIFRLTKRQTLTLHLVLFLS